MNFQDSNKCILCSLETGSPLCPDCFEKLQSHYAQKCLNCGNYNFITWNLDNVKKLAKDICMDFEELWTTDKIVIIPFSQCPKCCKHADSMCKVNIKEVINPKWS